MRCGVGCGSVEGSLSRVGMCLSQWPNTKVLERYVSMLTYISIHGGFAEGGIMRTYSMVDSVCLF